jgi:lipopolysaccharide export system permease protein
MLRIMDRYILREFLLFLLLGMSTFVGLYLVVDLFEKIDVFVDHQAQASHILAYYANSLPLIIIQVLPVAMLLASILSLGQLRKFNEITAMQSSGLSPLRITRPLLLVALLITLVAYVVSEQVVPDSYQRQKSTLEVQIKKRHPGGARTKRDIYYMGRGGRVYIAREFRPARQSMADLAIQSFASIHGKQKITRRADAGLAYWHDGHWQLQDGFVRIFLPDSVSASGEAGAAFKRYGDSRFEEQPDEFAQPANDPFNMNRQQLSEYIDRIRDSGARVTQYVTDYHLRAAFPLSNFIMVLLGTCLSLRIMRGTLALGFGLSISLGFGYYGFLRVGQALGYNGNLPPLLAAWLGNLIFLLIGALLFWKANR